ncbi:MAG TPA: glycosyltransferase family 2 protein [Terracidiphilus sp.]|nr:glycosyltransferase family 2 protein [Terracidiphilus sp.]
MPLVTVVIPTRNRPALVCRAVRSVLEQTYKDLEIIVVLDGPDPRTVSALSVFDDSRLRVIALENNVGGNEARNIGVREATGGWIAFLDDDDEWLPGKIAAQVAIARKQSRSNIVIATRYIVDRGTTRRVQPLRLPRVGQPMSEYLFCEVPLLGWRESFLGLSTWMISKRFLQENPFRAEVRKNQDTDWLLRAVHDPGGQIIILEEPAAVFHCEERRARVSSSARFEWKYSRDWALSTRDMFTRRALSYFLITISLPCAVREKAGMRSYRLLFGDCRRYGRITAGVVWFEFRELLLFPFLKRLGIPAMIHALRCVGCGCWTRRNS